MSKALPIAVAVLLGGAALIPVYYATQNPEVQTTKASKNASAIDKISYGLGYELTQQTPPELNIDSFVNGARDGHNRVASAYSQEELNAAYEQFQQDMQKKMLEEVEQSQVTSDAFLIENAKVTGVQTTASGLQYKVEKPGTGKSPAANSVVKVHYTGKLVDGKVFDSSVERGEPIEFPLNQVIPGWTEGLQLMKEGEKATLYIPSNLGYGPQGVPGTIPPNSTLIFDVELIEVK